MSDGSFAQLPLAELMDGVREAARCIAGHAQVTPVVTSAALDSRLGASVFLKCENLQRGGAFKFRGAWNAISRLSDEERARGVVAYSSGNHAQAVALVGRMLGVRVTVVMPEGSSELKRRATMDYGASVVGCPVQEREAAAKRIRDETGAVLVPPFDHPDVICGQGTLAMELHSQAPGLQAVLVPVGGGGLISGVAIATRALSPGCRIVGVEPEACDDARRSLAAGTLQTCEGCASIADGVRTRNLGRLTWPLVRRFVDEVVTVSESSIAEAVRFLIHRTKLVVEPSGALGVAALLSGAYPAAGRIGVVLSGGNVDGRVMAAILSEDGAQGA